MLYVLNSLPLTDNANWTQISFGGVTSIQGQTGTVSLNTDDIPEGANKYFDAGISQYLAINANTSDNLAKLDTNAYMKADNLNPHFLLDQGTVVIEDD